MGGGDINLETVLAGVPGVRDARGRGAHLAIHEPIVADGGEVHGRQFLHGVSRLGALDGKLGVTAAREIHARVKAVERADVLEIFLLVGGVDTKEVMVLGDLVDQDVVHESAVRIEQPGVLRLADFQLVDGVGGGEIGELRGLRPVDFDLTHVADIENPDGAAHGLVLVDDSGVLDGHVPPAEIHHFGAQGAMNGIQRSGFERGRRGHEIQANSSEKGVSNRWLVHSTDTVMPLWLMLPPIDT